MNKLSNKFTCCLSIIIIIAMFFCIPVVANQNSGMYLTAKRYNLNGQLTAVIHPYRAPTSAAMGTAYDFYATRYTYNGGGLLAQVEHGILSSWKNETVDPKDWNDFNVYHGQTINYNNRGWRSTVISWSASDQTRTLTQYSYTSIGLVACMAVRMNPLAYNNLPASACDLGPEGEFGPDRITRYEYNGRFGQVTREHRAVGTAQEQIYVVNEYSSRGLRTGVTDANGNFSKMEYDSKGRLEYWFFPDKQVVGSGVHSTTDYEKYSYDNNGNRTSLRKRDGQIIGYVYDGLNHLVRKNMPDNPNRSVLYQYDLRGMQLEARFVGGTLNDTGIVGHKYDGHGRLIREAVSLYPLSTAISYQYDNNDNRTHITHPDGHTFRYHYEGRNLLSSVSANSNNSSIYTRYHDDLARLQRLHRSNAVTTHFDYDGLSRLAAIEEEIALANYHNTFSYSHNPANQLTSINTSNGLYHYKGDNTGFLGDYTVNGLNQYTHVDGKTLQYDANGNLISDGNNTYTYDAENRLIGVSGAKNAIIHYDPLGRIRLIHSGGQTTYFIHDGDALIAEYGSANQMTKRYVHGPGVDQPLVEYDGSSAATPRFLHSNHQGSIVAATNSGGGVAYINTYDPYGVPGNANQGRFGYTGQIYLPELELYYYKARMYSPKLGRFLQTDPVGYEDQMNLYAYVHNDPLNYTDPTGMWSEDDDILVIGTRGVANSCECISITGDFAKQFVENVADSLEFSMNMQFALLSYMSTRQFVWVANESEGGKNFPAPGKPSEEDGFRGPKKPPRNSDKNGRVNNPNGSGKGWVDADGNVWVPTGGKAAHGGEHWDVQVPGGGHINVYPGGKRR